MTTLVQRVTDLAAAVRDKFNAIADNLITADGTVGYVYTKTAEGHGWAPAGGGSLPSGGTNGQVLGKASSTDGDATWRNPTVGASSAFTVAVTGSFITGVPTGGAGYTNNAFGADGFRLAPWIPTVDVTIDRIGLNITSAGVGAVCKMLVYEANANGLPGTLLRETSSNIDCSTTGYKFDTWTYTFKKGVQYWIGFKSGVATFNAACLSGGYGLSIGHSGTSVAGATYLSLPGTPYANNAVNSPSITTSHFFSGISILVWMRVA